MPRILGDGHVPLDPAAIARMRRTLRQEHDFQALLREFLASSTTLLAEVERSHPPGSRVVERAAHTLKSMARLLGAEALAEACRVVEFAAHGARAPPVPVHLVDEMAFQLRATQEAVERLLA